MPLNGLNSHTLSKVIFIVGLKERDYTCNNGDGILLFLESGLKVMFYGS
jgi:hypothetical protein